MQMITFLWRSFNCKYIFNGGDKAFTTPLQHKGAVVNELMKHSEINALKHF